MWQSSCPNCVTLFPVSICGPAHQRLRLLSTGPGRPLQQQIIDSFAQNLGGACAHHPNPLLRQRKPHIASTINCNARGVCPDNYSLGRRLQTINGLKDRVGTEIILFLVVI